MSTRLADRFILKPTTHPIPTDGKSRRVIDCEVGSFEVWCQRSKGASQSLSRSDGVDLFILKFPGTGGRAERMAEHPAEAWPDLSCEIWAVNPPGYGTSGGTASVQWIPAVASAAFDAIHKKADGRPVMVTGNSLGTVSALYVAARHEIKALLLRNAPPLRELISRKHGWWNFGASWFVARQVPNELCSITNASASGVPALFVVSARDRTVPPAYQRRIIDAYNGERRTLLLPGAGHATPVSEDELPTYVDLLSWLRTKVEAADSRTNVRVRTIE